MYAESADEIIKLNMGLKTERGQWDSLWQDLADYVMPRKSTITEKKTADVEGYTDNLHSTEAIHSNITLAAGQLDYMVSSKWFEFEAPRKGMDRDSENWYKACSEVVLDILQESNFQLEIHEFFIDRGGFGTAHIHCDEDEDDVVVFQNCAVGTYSVIENAKGLIDGVVYEREFTAKQALQKFGAAALGEEISRCANDQNNKDQEKKFPFIHAIFPRDPNSRDSSKADGANKRIASVWVSVKEKKIYLRSGYDEQPFAVSRFLKWANEKYGYCPSIEALPAIKQHNFIEHHMDALAELAANPRMLVPSDMEGDVDYRAGGVTVFDPNNPNAKPQEWATQGRYDVGIDRSKSKAELIRRAYHVDLFQLLTQFDEMRREKTAYEVSQMLAEKLTRISPTFERIKVEVFKPILTRTFAIAFRQGRLPPPPPGVINANPDGVMTLTVPKLNYTSKLAMAIKAVQNSNFLTFMQMVLPLVEIAGSQVTNEINFARSVRGLGLNQGVPADFWNTRQEKEALEEAQAQQAEQEAKMQMTERSAKAAGDFGKAPASLQKQALGG